MNLFNPYNDKGISLKNRIVMAPMTRARNPDGIPNQMNARYYAQRAGSGLIITEGIAISDTAKGVMYIPGLYTDPQVEGWKQVTAAVHAEGSKIFAQLWHVGRVSHTSNQPGGIAPVSASDIPAANSMAWGLDADGQPGFVPVSIPRPLSTTEVRDIVKDFARAAQNAIAAGFDGIEIHGANGYLVEQFLNPYVNIRRDQYGGNIENRSRFLFEIIDACIDAIGAAKVAIRLTPHGGLYDMKPYPEVNETYFYIAGELYKRNIAFIDIMDQHSRGSFALPDGFLAAFRQHYPGIIILTGGMTKAKGQEYIDNGWIDLVGFGEAFIANPDLVKRLENDWPLTTPDRTLHYGGQEHGYVDYGYYREENN
ncbi:alkene reductase [Chitinophaga caeni]|uniref:Alkene reductase n=1 Tax=Chitinophaga caeni TaxID=2029983 RepID=A0A291QQI5_9BACT|nr:alkene reductase [Chitinophaga caeni]ATL46197.1 alkene reductase [Chitinophaga caeni]